MFIQTAVFAYEISVGWIQILPSIKHTSQMLFVHKIINLSVCVILLVWSFCLYIFIITSHSHSYYLNSADDPLVKYYSGVWMGLMGSSVIKLIQNIKNLVKHQSRTLKLMFQRLHLEASSWLCENCYFFHLDLCSCGMVCFFFSHIFISICFCFSDIVWGSY